MSWLSDDSEHEGWSVAEFPDGRVDVGDGADGVYVRTLEEALSNAGDPGIPDLVDGRTAIGWRGVCSCGWYGPLWRRVPTQDRHAPDRHLVYWQTGPNAWAEPADAIEDAIRDEWLGHLPSPALGEIKAAALAVRKATNELDDAVSRSRLDGATWAAIGDAAGMSRQAANERWGKRL